MRDFKDDIEFLLQGVTEFDIEGKEVPSEIFVHGSSAFPVGFTPDKKAFIAGARYGQGRVIAAGHERYLDRHSLSTFLINALLWLDQGRKGVVGILPKHKGAYHLMSRSVLQCQLTNLKEGLSVFVCESYDDTQSKQIQEFIAGGGGLLIGGHAWWWAQSNPKSNLVTDCPGNQMLYKMGLCLLGKTVKAGLYQATQVKQHGTSHVHVFPNVDFKDDLEFLLQGVSEFDIQGKEVPSEIFVHGSSAFPVGFTPDKKAFIAGARYGQGRVIAVGHERYLDRNSLSTFLINALLWLDRGRKGVVGILPQHKGAYHLMSRSGLQCQLTNLKEGLSVFVCESYDDTQSKEIQEFVAGGGGLLIGGHAWWWVQSNPKRNLVTDCPGNQILYKMGLCLLGKTVKAGLYQATQVKQHGTSHVHVFPNVDFKDDLEFLLQGVSEFDIQGKEVPSEIFVHGSSAFPVGFTPDAKAFIAGARYGQGRVIAAGHERYLDRNSLSTFLINALFWLDRGRKGVVGILPQHKGAYHLMSRSGLQCQLTNLKEGLSVFVCESYDDTQSKEIQEFVAGGGGLLIGGHAWWWVQSKPKCNLVTDCPGNRILYKMGLCLLGKTVKAGLYPAAQVKQHGTSQIYVFPNMLHRFVQHVFHGQQLTDQEQQFLSKLGSDCVSCLRMQGQDCSCYNLLMKLVKKAGLPKFPLTNSSKHERDLLLLQVATELSKVCKEPETLLSDFIVDSPDLPSVTDASVCISACTKDHTEWISAGLYLSPGMISYITVPQTIVGKGWQVQIGCQTDDLSHHKDLKRAPVLHARFPVDKEKLKIWNLWGGLIYLIAPANTTVNDEEVVIRTAVKVPYYKSGCTSVREWNDEIRKAPAPWAELEFENLIITLPSDVIRDLRQPDSVATRWDSIMRAVADLAAKPAKFLRKERFVADVQISGGYMHAGYPIMMHSISAPDLVNPYVVGKSDFWGPVHELGHNQQRSVWEFPPHTTECTNNLWSLYVYEVVLGVNKENAHKYMTKDKRQKRINQYIMEGRQLKNWTVWTALETYTQLQEKFGWEAFKKVFAAYHNFTDVPKHNEGKMNLYANTFSTVVKKNLAPFFKEWGWPIQPSTEKELSGFPEWSDHPMAYM
ncbi:TRPM8 channel-associated factor homolog [Trichomycterus rosablanca]|uniref:TRPM8 channel-associated factor homolog n=1 Tax=Trichomycterus rosablanca TaxID=2290929 RepID=UPI002F35BE84